MNENQKLGTIMKELIRFSLPLILSGVLQQLYNWADAFIVGNVDGELSLSAIGVTSIPISFFITTITGFTLGLSVLIAKNFGAKKQDSIPPVLAVFAVILGGVFLLAAAVGSALSYPFMELLHTPADTIDLASGYIRIIFWGLPFLAVYNVYTATLRGLGDSRIPFLSILVSSVINVLLDILFVAELRWGVLGAAAATVLSQAIMTVFIVLYGTSKYPWLKSNCRKESFCGAVVRDGLRYGLPPMVQSSISALGSLVLQDFMNRFGTDTVTAITTAYRIDTLILLPIVNLGSGISTVTAHSHGAGDTIRTRKTLSAGTILTLVVSDGPRDPDRRKDHCAFRRRDRCGGHRKRLFPPHCILLSDLRPDHGVPRLSGGQGRPGILQRCGTGLSGGPHHRFLRNGSAFWKYDHRLCGNGLVGVAAGHVPVSSGGQKG